MFQYSDYRLDLRILSSVGTRWQSDTIMGHLAWFVALREGEPAVRNFLEPFLKGAPPFVLSDGFPYGLVPRPLFPQREDREELSAEASSLAKKRSKAPYVSVEVFDEFRRGEVDEPEPYDSPCGTFEMLHAVIDRGTFSTGGEGNIFSTISEAPSGNSDKLSVYVRTKENYREKIARWFEGLAKIGFGRDKSTGSGQFEVEDLVSCDLFSSFEGADSFISLSTWLPAGGDPTEGFWKVNIKRGKLGEGAGKGNPFKRPLIQFVPGSVFHTGDNPAPWYGRAVREIAPGMPEAVQICYCFAVPAVFRS